MPQDKLTAVRIKQANGQYGPQIPVGARAEHVKYDNMYSVKEVLGNVKTNVAPLQEQIDNIDTEAISEAVTDWLEDNPGALLPTDKTLSIADAPADAQQAGKVVTVNSETDGNATKLHLNTTNQTVNILTTDDIDPDIIDVLINNFADEFDSTSAYSVGDYCTYNGLLYKANTATAANDGWIAARWTQINVTSQITSVNDIIKDVITPIMESTVTTMDDDSEGVTSYNGYIKAEGAYTASSGYKTCMFPVAEDCTFYVDYPTSYKNLGIYSSSSPSKSTCIQYIGQTGAENTTVNNQRTALAGQYIAASYRPQSATELRVTIHFTVTTIEGYELKSTVELTDTMTEQVQEMISESSLNDTMREEVTEMIEAPRFEGYKMSGSALLYKRNLPDYYNAYVGNSASYDYDQYIEERIKSIPNGRHFIFVTDTHWPGNEKKTNDLIQYVRSRIGDVDVVFGGDVVDANNTPYASANVIKAYFNESVAAYGDRFLPVLGNHDTNQVGTRETTKAERFIPYSVLAELFTRHIADRVNLRDESEAIAEKTSDPAVAAEYDAYFKLNYSINLDSGITIIVYNTGATGIFNQEAFGLNGEDEIYLHQKWLYNTLMSVPEGNDVVLIGHEATYGKADPLNSWNHRSAVSLVCGFAAKKNVKLYQMPAVMTEKTAPWVPSNSYPAYNFTNAPNSGKVFMMQGHWHHDFVVKVGISSNQEGVNFTRLTVEDWNGEDSFDLSSGEIPIVTTICDARGNYINGNSGGVYTTDPSDFTMTAGTVTEQAFDVVTMTDSGVVTTRFGAAERPEYLQRVMTFERS